jgi:hypothetical protein
MQGLTLAEVLVEGGVSVPVEEREGVARILKGRRAA